MCRLNNSLISVKQTSLINLLECLQSGNDRGFRQQLGIFRSMLILNGAQSARKSPDVPRPNTSVGLDFGEGSELVEFYEHCSCIDVIQSLLWAFPKLAWTRRARDNALPLHIVALIGNVKLARILAAAVSTTDWTPSVFFGMITLESDLLSISIQEPYWHKTSREKLHSISQPEKVIKKSCKCFFNWNQVQRPLRPRS